MIKEISTYMNEYGQAFEQIQGVYNKAKKHCDDTYNPKSQVYATTLETAYKVRTQALNPLIEKYNSNISKAIQDVRAKIQKVITTKPTAEQMETVSIINSGILSETEKAMMLESLKGNYLALKMVSAESSEVATRTKEILSALDNVEKWTNAHINADGTPSESYYSRVMMHPEGYLKDLEDSLNVFFGMFPDQNGDNS